jgi:hypothetical protein
MRPDDRCGSFPDFGAIINDVRFISTNRHFTEGSVRSAKCQQQTSARLHSMTSSAKADNDGGMVSCSNLAVCILIRNDK